MAGQKATGWDELEGVSDASEKVLKLPATSEVAGKDIFVKIRSVTPEEISKAFNFPLDEVRQISLEAEDAETSLGDALKEHTSTFDTRQLYETIESVIKVGLVEPDPAGGDIKKLGRDYNFIFAEIVKLTVSAEAVAEAARFRSDG